MSSDVKTVLVTGGSGRIGNYLVTALLDRGYKVVNIDSHKQRDERASFVSGDVRERAFVQEVMSGCDVVCHLAEIPHAAAALPRDEIYWANARAGAVVMQAAVELKLQRVIYTSTSQVYGCWDQGAVGPVRLPFDETHPLQPGNVYSLSKAANEGYALLAHRASGVPISIFRFPMVLVGEAPGGDYMRRYLNDDNPPYAFGTYVHATDAAGAYLAAIEVNWPGIEAYNIFADDVISRSPIRPRIIRHFPDYPPLPVDWPDYKSPVLAQKAKDQLHWKAAWNFREHAAGVM